MTDHQKGNFDEALKYFKRDLEISLDFLGDDDDDDKSAVEWNWSIEFDF